MTTWQKISQESATVARIKLKIGMSQIQKTAPAILSALGSSTYTGSVATG